MQFEAHQINQNQKTNFYSDKKLPSESQAPGSGEW